MPNPILGVLTEQVTQTKQVIASATVLINGINDKIKAAVEAALANGATAEELAPFVELEKALESETTALSTAVAANTPTPPPPVEPPSERRR